jgi:hypothetical protein
LLFYPVQAFYRKIRGKRGNENYFFPFRAEKDSGPSEGHSALVVSQLGLDYSDSVSGVG